VGEKRRKENKARTGQLYKWKGGRCPVAASEFAVGVGFSFAAGGRTLRTGTVRIFSRDMDSIGDSKTIDGDDWACFFSLPKDQTLASMLVVSRFRWCWGCRWAPLGASSAVMFML